MATRKATPSSTEIEALKSTAIDFAALLPDLVATTTMEIEGKDVNFPRLKISHPSQIEFVPELVPAFAIYSELNKDDDNKVTLYEVKKGQDKPDLEAYPDLGILVYVLAMKKGLSANVDDNNNVVSRDAPGATFRSWAFNDPSAARGPGVDTTYNYVLYTPELDDADKPHRLLMTRSSTPTAVTINTFLDDARRQGLPGYTVPFRIWSEHRERTDNGQKQHWGVFKARPVTPDLEFVKNASTMTARVNELEASRPQIAIDPDADVADATVVNATAEPAI